MHDHVLIIGGTGMLKQASVALAARCSTLTSVARSRGSLAALNASTIGLGVTHHLLQLDWRHTASFVRCLAEHTQRVGAPSLILAWLHDDELGPQIASALAPVPGPCRFFQVRGSAAADPAAAPTALPEAAAVGISLHQIILGFHRDSDGSRWLRNAEISAGVLAAIDRPRDVTVVGTVTPWSARP